MGISGYKIILKNLRHPNKYIYIYLRDLSLHFEDGSVISGTTNDSYDPDDSKVLTSSSLKDIKQIIEDVKEFTENVKDILDKLDEFEEDISDINEDIDDINEDISDINDDIDNINDDISDINDDISDINTDLTNVTNQSNQNKLDIIQMKAHTS
jgi:chromosome segregation ATPase